MSSINLKALGKIKSFTAMSKKRAQDISRGALMEVGYRLVYRSAIGDPNLWHPSIWPKGYVPGLFINNWQVGIDAPPKGVINSVDETGSGSYARLEHLGRWTVGHKFYFVNNLPYASLLESGLWSSQVGPGGMVKLTTMEFNSIVKEVAARTI